ncbi:MAG TPA: ScpA family protein [Acidimicrobiales bacterium]|nr:ScpA family protein [Acidimicrobiales bacterium]
MTYAVSTPVFEGPIDLLLHLVSSHEVDILDIPLLPLVDAFVHVLSEQRDRIDFNQLSEFLLVAAILIELKSQKLLPGREVTDDGDDLIGWEERDLLLARLLECRAYAAAADVFVGMAEQASRSIPREVGLDDGFAVHAPDLLAGITPDDLAQAFLRGVAERPVPRVDLSHVTVDTVSVAEAVSDLMGVPRAMRATSFRLLVEGCTTRMEIIVQFLALLELCKLGHLNLGQGATFGDLQIDWLESDAVMMNNSSGRGLAEMAGLEVDDYEG